MNELNPEIRSKVSSDLQLAFKHDIPLIPIIYIINPIAFNSELRNIDFQSLERMTLAWENVYKESWIEDEDNEDSDKDGLPIITMKIELILLSLVLLSVFFRKNKQITY